MTKMPFFRRKLAKVAGNCDHNIDLPDEITLSDARCGSVFRNGCSIATAQLNTWKQCVQF
jgi:hypothetical protein